MANIAIIILLLNARLNFMYWSVVDILLPIKLSQN